MVYFVPSGGRNIDLQVRIDTTNLSNAIVECTFYQPGYTCTIEYGTDPSYANLDYRDTSPTLGRTATITFAQMISEETTYYYTVSAESSSQCVRVRAGAIKTSALFLIPMYLLVCGGNASVLLRPR